MELLWIALAWPALSVVFAVLFAAIGHEAHAEDVRCGYDDCSTAPAPIPTPVISEPLQPTLF